jgi:hypothetical protein
MMLSIPVIRISNTPIDRLLSQFWIGQGRRRATRWSASGMYGDNVLKAEADSFVTWSPSATAPINVCFSIGFAYQPFRTAQTCPKLYQEGKALAGPLQLPVPTTCDIAKTEGACFNPTHNYRGLLSPFLQYRSVLVLGHYMSFISEVSIMVTPICGFEGEPLHETECLGR